VYPDQFALTWVPSFITNRRVEPVPALAANVAATAVAISDVMRRGM
jgi:hypothetical protein